MVAPPSTAFTFIHVEDLVRALLLCAEADRASGETFFLGHSTPSTAAELSAHLAEAFGTSYRPLRVPSALVRVAGAAGDVCWKLGLKPAIDSARAAEVRADGFVCSVEKARALLGFSAARPLADGVAQTARWYRERGWV
jgi:nucleoside-diphosphate-sugar epimerase